MYNRMRGKLALLQKMATLRSGARGSQARKESLAFEKQVEEAKEKYATDECSRHAKDWCVDKAQALIARSFHSSPMRSRPNLHKPRN